MHDFDSGERMATDQTDSNPGMGWGSQWLLTEATTPQALAYTLTKQLGRSISGFREAQQSFVSETPYTEQQKLDTLEKQLVGPLKWLEQLNQGVEVRIVIDALDRLAIGARGSVMDALSQLGKLRFVHLVVTARPDTGLPRESSVYALAFVPDEKVCQYLQRRKVPQARQSEVVQAACGSWLVARVLADLLCDQPEAPIGAGQLALGDAYEEMLSRCGVTDDGNLRHVLEVLAAAGAGPLLPLALLCKASETLGGPGTPAQVRDQLVRLRGLVVRTGAGTDKEHTGLFHQTLVDHVAACALDENMPAHRALVAGIETLALIRSVHTGPADLNDPIQRYAFEREAEHLWKFGEIEQSLICLSERSSPVPSDNLRRWRLWLVRVAAQFGADHQVTFVIRNNIAQAPPSAETHARRCGYSRRYFPTRSACLDPITRRHSKPAAISVTRPASPEICVTRYG